MRNHRAVATVLAAAAVLALTAASATATAAPRATGAAPNVTPAQLALMPLPAAKLVHGLQGTLSVSSDSGVQTNAEAAEDSFDPKDSAASLSRDGRISGYDLTYETSGIASVGSDVTLFGTAAQASAFLAKRAAEMKTYEGKEVAPGARILTVATWKPAAVGDESAGVDATLSAGGVTMRITSVALRVDRVMGSVTILDVAGKVNRTSMEASARALAARIQGVLDGTVTGSPVPVPGAAATATTPSASSAPARAALARSAALSAADVGPGTTIGKDAFPKPDEDALVALERDFDVDKARIGSGTRLISLQNEVTIFRTEAGARAFAAGITAIYTGPSAGQMLTDSLAGDPDMEGAKFTVKTVRKPKLGDGAVLLTTVFSTRFGTFRALFGLVRDGRTVSALIVTGAPATTRDADILGLLKTAATRAAEQG